MTRRGWCPPVGEFAIPPAGGRYVTAALDPRAFGRCFVSWVREGAIVAIDGSRSYDAASDCPAIKLVSAWAREKRLTLGQVKVAAGSNEIWVVPELLRMLALKGKHGGLPDRVGVLLIGAGRARPRLRCRRAPQRRERACINGYAKESDVDPSRAC